MAQAALGSAGVTTPGSVAGAPGDIHGLVVNMGVVLGWWLCLMILEIFSHLNDSVIP